MTSRCKLWGAGKVCKSKVRGNSVRGKKWWGNVKCGVWGIVRRHYGSGLLYCGPTARKGVVVSQAFEFDCN